jgi:hypothetical protein
MDRLSVKFEFNGDTDTAEEVVNEMVFFCSIQCNVFIFCPSNPFWANLNRLRNKSSLIDINSSSQMKSTAFYET